VPFELRVVPEEFLARIRGFGMEAFASTQAAMKRISEDPRLAPGMPVLMDVRELDYLATPPEVAWFAAPGSMPGVFSGRRVAIVARRGTQFGVAHTFAAKAAPSGSEIEVFAEPELALAWLKGSR
jgi:hypothetical protein